MVRVSVHTVTASAFLELIYSDKMSHTSTPHNTRRTTHSVEEIEESHPQIIVYFVRNKDYTMACRGFVHPYDITVEMSSKKQVLERLRVMTKAYEEMLSEHGNPANLSKKVLSDKTDAIVYDMLRSNTSLGRIAHVETYS